MQICAVEVLIKLLDLSVICKLSSVIFGSKVSTTYFFTLSSIGNDFGVTKTLLLSKNVTKMSKITSQYHNIGSFPISLIP